MDRQTFNPADWNGQSAAGPPQGTASGNRQLSDAEHVELVISRIGATDITADYDKWWKDCGMAFANTFGEGGRRYFHDVSRNYSGYDVRECDRQYDYCLKSGRGLVGLGSFFQLAKDHGIDVTYSDSDCRAVHDTRRKAERMKENAEKAEKRPLTADRVAELLSSVASWRYNVVKECVEYQLPGKDFQRVDDYAVNSLWRQISRECGKVSANTVWNIINSDFSPEFNPVSHYLQSLAPWDGTTDHIAALASMVHTDGHDPEFVRDFRKWLVAMVACWTGRAVNQQILVLVGPQGIYKTSWLNALLPPVLREYSTSHLNFSQMSKDDQLAISQNLLINLDELDALSSTELNLMKSLATAEYTNERQAYARTRKYLPRIASFCGSGNNEYLLTDRTGNRRWLVFRITGIDSPFTNAIHHDAVYSQALALLDSGFKYWFDYEDIRDINARNREFEAPDPAEEFIQSYFRKPVETEGTFMTATDILEHCPFASRQSITPAKIGRAMKKLGYERIAKRIEGVIQRGYIVVFIDAEMRQTNKRSTAREIYLESHPQDDDE